VFLVAIAEHVMSDTLRQIPDVDYDDFEQKFISLIEDIYD
jgi:hypothetical protein